MANHKERYWIMNFSHQHTTFNRKNYSHTASVHLLFHGERSKLRINEVKSVTVLKK